MKFESIKKVQQGKYISRYDITYRTVNDNEKVYEMISRNHNIITEEQLHNNKADAVVLIIHSEDDQKILLNCEFRLAIGDWVYNFPAGLIDAGETPEESAKRELREETGLNLTSINDIMYQSYSAVGFSNETNVCVVGTAAGTMQASDSEFEEIKAGWYTKSEIRQLLKENKFAARTQAYCYMWSK